MFGGPWLGVIVFVLIAVGLGWGVAKFFQAVNDVQPSMTDGVLRDNIDPDAIYTLKTDLLLGYTANGTPTLFPSRDDLPRHAYGRRAVPTIAQALAMDAEQLAQRDLAGVVARSTPVRFVELVRDPGNQQTPVMLMVEVLQGPHASPTPVLGMHLESADTDEATGAKRYPPREDLFAPVQSPAQAMEDTDDAPEQPRQPALD